MLFKALVAGAAAAAGVSATLNAARAEQQLAASATPITKVVELLKEMKAENEKEAAQDKEIYDKMACWCHTNREEKKQAIADNTALIASLDASIKEGIAKSAKLAEEIKTLIADIAENEDSLAKATEVRNKEAAEFHTTETDSIQALGQLKGAITILSKHHEMPSTEQSTDGISSGTGGNVKLTAQQAGALLQTNELDSIASTVKAINQKMGGNLITDSDMSLIQARPYAAQSGEIFGILNAMQEQMTKDLSEAQAAEAKSAAEFAALREAKEAELSMQRSQKSNKEDDKAATDLQKAQDKKNYEETVATLEADQEFLADLEKRCAVNEKEMEERTKYRLAEIKALNETIDILMEDDARDLAKTTLSFLQKVSSTKDRLSREMAAKALARVARKTGSPELTMLATTVQLDAFTKVKKAIDDLVAALKKEAADEVKHKDYCEKALHENEDMEATQLSRELELLQGEKADLESKSEALATTIAETKAAIAQAQLELQRATENRLAASKVFQQATLDQQGMQAVLKKAIKRMEAFYAKEGAFLQQKQAPQGLKAGGYTKMTAGANGVIGMLTEILGDSQVSEKELLMSEQDEVSAYEEFVGATNKSVTEMQAKVVSSTKAKADTDEEIVQKTSDISANLKAQEANNAEVAALHTECDFTLKNFEVRQSTRQEEIEALQQAKSILSGAA